MPRRHGPEQESRTDQAGGPEPASPRAEEPGTQPPGEGHQAEVLQHDEQGRDRWLVPSCALVQEPVGQRDHGRDAVRVGIQGVVPGAGRWIEVQRGPFPDEHRQVVPAPQIVHEGQGLQGRAQQQQGPQDRDGQQEEGRRAGGRWGSRFLPGEPPRHHGEHAKEDRDRPAPQREPQDLQPQGGGEEEGQAQDQGRRPGRGAAQQTAQAPAGQQEAQEQGRDQAHRGPRRCALTLGTATSL